MRNWRRVFMLRWVVDQPRSPISCFTGSGSLTHAPNCSDAVIWAPSRVPFLFQALGQRVDVDVLRGRTTPAFSINGSRLRIVDAHRKNCNKNAGSGVRPLPSSTHQLTRWR